MVEAEFSTKGFGCEVKNLPSLLDPTKLKKINLKFLYSRCCMRQHSLHHDYHMSIMFRFLFSKYTIYIWNVFCCLWIKFDQLIFDEGWTVFEFSSFHNFLNRNKLFAGAKQGMPSLLIGFRLFCSIHDSSRTIFNLLAIVSPQKSL